jgi:hypothetical protein
MRYGLSQVFGALLTWMFELWSQLKTDCTKLDIHCLHVAMVCCANIHGFKAFEKTEVSKLAAELCEPVT